MASRQHMSTMQHMEAGVATASHDTSDSSETIYDRLLDRRHQSASSPLRPRRSPGSRHMGHAATVALACMLACGEGCCGNRSDRWWRPAAGPLMPGLRGLARSRRRQRGSAIRRRAVVTHTHVKMYVYLVRQVGGRGAPRCGGRWRMLVYEPFERAGMVVETVGSSAATGVPLQRFVGRELLGPYITSRVKTHTVPA